MERLSGTEEASVMDINHQESDPSENKVGICSSRRSHVIIGNTQPDAIINFANRTSYSGLDKGRNTDSLSSKLEEFALNLAQVEAESEDSNEGISPEHLNRDSQKKNDQNSGLVEVFASESSLLKPPEKLPSISRFQVCKHAEEHTAKTNASGRVIPPLTCSHPQGKQCAGGEQSLILNGMLCCRYSSSNLLAEDRKDHFDMDVTATSQSLNEGEERTLKMLRKENPILLDMTPNKCRNPPEQRKDKERVFDVGDNGSFSREKDDSHESVESSTSKEPFSAGKRARGFEPHIFTGSKKLKNSNNEKSCSGSLLREGSSFMNWISNVTKVFFRSESSDPVERPLMLVQNSFHNRHSLSPSKSHDENKDAACRNIGFQSFFQALYHPELKGQCKRAVSLDHIEEAAGFKELQVDSKTIDYSGDQIVHDGEHSKSHKSDPISCMRLNHGICKFREFRPTVPDISLHSSPVQERLKYEVGEYCKIRNIGLSSSSFQNGSSSLSESKEASKLGSVLPNTFPNSSLGIRASGFPGSLWITRFSPKASALMSHTMHCNQGMSSAAEKITEDCNSFIHHSQKHTVSVRHHNDLEDCRQSPLEEQGVSTSGHLQICSSSAKDSFCLKKVHNDQKLKSKLNPILPSQTFKQMEPMASIFAKRLDAFRHISTSKVANDTKFDARICLFCGKGGHSINQCSEVIGSELKDLLRDISSYDEAEKATGICIHCFQRNHWAATCPHASSTSSHHVDGTASIINYENSLRTERRNGKYASFINNCDAEICNKSKNGQGQPHCVHRIPCRENLAMGTDVMLQTGIDLDVDRSALNSYPVKENILGKGLMKGKQIVSSSVEEPNAKQSIPFFDFMAKKIPDEQSRIFERIRKLCLSRSDIVRWMKSTVSPVKLEGFFLRLRLGKLEEGLGGTGYHVASISGASKEKLLGSCRTHVPVSIGGSKCLIDCRFISNQDFVEDELKAWWSSTLKCCGKLPSEEELDKKLQEREKFDF